MCSTLWKIGAKKIAVVVRKAIPLYNAYKEEKSLAVVEGMSTTGPMPVKIMHDI
jgi:hypothetical protein